MYLHLQVHMFSLLDDNLQFIDIAITSKYLGTYLADGITLCYFFTHWLQKSNSMTIIGTILLSMLLVNIADINKSTL